MACKGDRRGNRGQHNRTGRVGASPAGAREKRSGAVTTPSGDRREKQGITSRKDRCGTKGARGDPMRVLSGLASTAGERRPARLLRSSRSPRAEATAACGTKARDGNVRRFRYRTPSLSIVWRIRRRGWSRVQCSVQPAIAGPDAEITEGQASRLHGHAAVGIAWSGKWSESFTGTRDTENQTFSFV